MKNKLNLHEKEPVCETHFHMNGFSRRLVLTQRQKANEIDLYENITLSSQFVVRDESRER